MLRTIQEETLQQTSYVPPKWLTEPKSMPLS